MRYGLSILLLMLLSGAYAAVSAQDAEQKTRVYLDANQSEIKIVEDDRLELHYYDNVKFVYKGAELYCDTAVWYEDRELLEFWGNVRYADSLHNLKSQYLQYLQAENRFISTGACELIDQNERVKIRGETIDFNRDTEELVVSDFPYLAVDYDDPAAIIEITSDTLHYFSRERHGKAIGNVKIIKGTMEATCDMSEFFPDTNLIILEGNPFALQRLNELQGDTMYITLKNKQLDKIRVAGNGRALYRKEVAQDETRYVTEDTSTALDDTLAIAVDTVAAYVDTLLPPRRPTFTESRIESKIITFFLEDELLSKIISAGNSYSWYTPAPEDTIAEGKNEASGDSVLLFFSDGDLNRVEIDNSCVGKFFSQMTTDSLGHIRYLDTVSYESSRLYYNISERIIYLVGRAQVNHTTVTLKADTITYNTTTKDMRASSTLTVADDDSIYVPVVLKDGAEEMTGERLVYNLDTKKGKIKESNTMLDKAYYRGEVVRKVDEDVLLVDCGKYIPCEYEDANFHFWSSKMKIINGDKVIAKPIVLYIEGLPVFYAPFFVFSIKKGRHSGFLPFRIGSWAKGGRYVDNLGYYWAISDYWDLETSMYIRENIGVAFNGKANYKKRYVMSGTIKGSFARDARTTFSGRSISNRWSLSLNHSHTLTPTASISGNGSFVSDKSYTRDVSNDLNERLNRNLRSQLNFSKRWEGSSLTAVIQSTKDLDRESSSSTLPKLTYRLNSRNIFSPPENADKSETRWYHNIRVSYNSNFQNFRSKTKVDTSFSRKEYAKAVHNATVSSPQSILKYLTVSPSLNYTENWFHIRPTDQTDSAQTEGQDLKTDKFLRSWKSSMSVSANTKLYGHFFPPIPGLVGIRHSMTPSMSFSYSPKSEMNAGEAKFVGASFSSSESKSMRVSLSNLFQMKYRSGDEEKKLDLFTMTTGASYNFKAEQRKWRTVSTSLRSSTIPVVNDVTVQATHDLYNPVTEELDLLKARLTSLSISSGFSMSGSAGSSRPTGLGEQDRAFPGQSAARPWSMTVRYRYGETRRAAAADISKSITHWITADARFNLTESFSVAISQNYDIRRKLIVNRSIRVTRDMRCWEAQFSWNPNGSLKGYYFKIFLKQLPDVKVEKSQSPLRGTLYD